MKIQKSYAYSEFEKKRYKKAMDIYANLEVSPMEVHVDSLVYVYSYLCK